LTQRSGNTYLPYQTTIYKHLILPMTPTLLQRTHGVLRSSSNYQKLETMKDPKTVSESSTNQFLTGILNKSPHCTQEKTLRFYCHRQRTTFARTHFPLRAIWKTNAEI